jgi:PAS domain S-box-containing protein
MKDGDKSKIELLDEIADLRKQLAEAREKVTQLEDLKGLAITCPEPTARAGLLEAFINHSPAVAFLRDEQGRYVYINREFEKLFKLTLSEIYGKTAAEVHPHEVAVTLEENNQAVLRTGETIELIESVPTADGLPRRWLVLKFPYLDQDGKRYVGGVAVDIEDRLKAEEALQIIFDSVPAMIWFKDRDNRILRVNDRVAELLGLSKAEIEGQSTYDLYPEDAAKYHKDDLEVINSGKPRLGIIETLNTASLGKRWVSTDKVPYYDEGGNIIGVIVFSVDITERKAAEEALRNAHDELEFKVEERTRELAEYNIFFSLSLDLLCIAELHDSRFRHINQAWERTLGYSMEELLSRSYLELIHPDDRERTIAAAAELQEGKNVINFENRYICKDGSVRVLHWNATAIPSRDLVFAVAHDITERKETEETIHKLNEDLELRVMELAAVNQELQSLTQKLERAYDQALEASNLKSEFVANISHEIRTPISGVIGMSELIMETALSTEQRQLASTIHSSAQTLLTIINDILDFSKMEAGKIDLETIDFSPVILIEGTAELLRIAARDKNLSLMTYIDPKIPAWLRGDPVRLRQVLLNLADNGVKFTDRGEVVVRAVLQNEDENVVSLSFSVTDTGIGLSEAACSKLFQPFVQADGSTTRRYGGTGLGLSICKRLVQLMGGEIGVESEEGRGSTFWFHAKFERSDRLSASKSSQLLATSYQLDGCRVLVVDNSSTAPDITGSYLSSAGLTCTSVAAAGEALKLLRRAARVGSPFELVVISLGDEASFNLAATIGAEPLIAKTPLVLVTASDETARSQQVASAEFAAVISKPVRETALIDATARALGRAVGLTTFADDGLMTELLARKPYELTSSVSDNLKDKRVLLAEDNLVLQNLAVRQLERLGLKADAVCNGQQAVQAVRESSYSAVLMDCQMPGMDGFEATMLIRQNEGERASRIPIIAMTASAMPGDRESCLAAGMNDYLCKPVSLESLRVVLERWLAPDAGSRTVDPSVQPPPADNGPKAPTDNTIDLNGLCDMYGQDALTEILELFIGEATQLLADLRAASAKEDRRTLSMVAHQLKGLAAVVCANKMNELSLELEKTASSATQERIVQMVETLVHSVDEVMALIKSHLDVNR